jgi:hypothetical protein
MAVDALLVRNVATPLNYLFGTFKYEIWSLYKVDHYPKYLRGPSIMIRNLAIVAIVAAIGYVSFTATSDATSSAKAISSKISDRTSAMNAAFDAQ